MKLSDFDYDLPKELIAYYPPKVRGESRLLVVDRKSGNISHDLYKNIPKYLNPEDLLVRNNSKVIPARIFGHTLTGKKLEVVVLERHFTQISNVTKAIIGRGRPENGTLINFTNDVSATVLSEENGIFTLEFNTNILSFLEEKGNVPLPLYIKRDATEEDRKTYQTIFAKNEGSVAAPTASLNFTKEIEEELLKHGTSIAEVTLHIGYGTFKPIKTENLEEHDMHSEYYEISKEIVDKIHETKGKGKVVALGTTVTRALEDMASKISPDQSENLATETNIFIYPGYIFKTIDTLITNFHAPKSTVLMMATAFAGKELLQKAYSEAIKEKYRFLSYGDSMIIL